MAGAVNCLDFSVPGGAVVYLVGRGATDLIEDTDWLKTNTPRSCPANS